MTYRLIQKQNSTESRQQQQQQQQQHPATLQNRDVDAMIKQLKYPFFSG